jgi:hypothetical protein
MQIKPATEHHYAVVELSQKDQEAIENMEAPNLFDVRLPEGLRLKVAKDEILTEEGRKSLSGDILEP